MLLGNAMGLPFRHGISSNKKYALYFDGVDDRVTIPNNVVFNMTEEITIEAWVKTGTNILSEQAFVEKQYSGQWEFAILNRGLKVNAFIGGQYRSGYMMATLLGLQPETWYHCVFTYKNGSGKIYLNGELKLENNNVSGPLGTANAALNIGQRFGNNIPFGGLLRDVRIWNISRSQEEIVNNMNKILQGNEKGLVGYFPLNEGYGDKAYNRATGIDGNIYGSTWVEV
ncbi:LamG domain-containing protein [Neobacillus notoginsengisoli]|uniref:LamG domain-containing protein n=1 Tax=Neobacillus notoginsengisoli TaxID=1578198 RepID=A0A417YR30_9BACI|nr:LamG domain-containing protein [Neobacillus notoginsengisoli]RHW37314.1 LamG domain-containing protein [Neobacillus notoginsengisoli]